MTHSFWTMLKQALLALGIALGLLGTANAGLVSGKWHPPFGTFLPNLSWSASFDFLAPNACSNQPDGDYATTGLCDLGTNYVQRVRLQLYNTGDAPAGYFELSPFYDWNHIANVRVKNQQIVGIDSNTANGELTYSAFCDTFLVTCVHYTFFSSPSSAMGNTFTLNFGLSGAKVTCLQCVDTFSDQPPGNVTPGEQNIDSSTLDLVQFLITYNDNAGLTPKFTDPDGGAIGARLDGSGTYLGQSGSLTAPVVPFNGSALRSSVPEPGALTLALTALAGVGVVGLRRRRRRRA